MELDPKKNADWQKVVKDIQMAHQAFTLAKASLKEFYSELPFEAFRELSGERQPKIVSKLFNFVGDITPGMLLNLVKEVEKQSSFLRDIPKEIDVSELE